MNKLSRSLVTAAFFAALSACTGFQGGTIPSVFEGASKITPISPRSFQLEWKAFPEVSKYNVYVPGRNDPYQSVAFTSFVFQPPAADSNIVYQYAVTAVDSRTALDQGDRKAYISGRLLEHFNFKTSGAISAVDKNSIRVSWNANPSVSYLVYLAERTATGVVNYNHFIAASRSVVGQGSAVIGNLQEGREYCAVVAAAYSDLSNDGPNGETFTTDVSSTLDSAHYSVGASGAFGDSVIAQHQKCVRTKSTFSSSGIKVFVQRASLTNQPTFYVSDPTDSVEDSSGNVSTSIYQANEQTGLSQLIGTRVGTGKLQAPNALATGRFHFFAVVTDRNTAAQDKIEINVGPNGATPNSEQDRKWVYVRGFSDVEDPATPLGYYPEKQQGGFGSQKEGSSVAVGDFNCDGKYDLAVGIPDATNMSPSDHRPAKAGKVVVYYNFSSGTPGTAGIRKDEITFDITGLAGDNARNLRLGTKLYAGNFNNDNAMINQHGGDATKKGFHCDDLAIGSGYGPMFVIYGKRDISAGDGGLNYSGPNGYTVNPSASCDPTSNFCQVGIYLEDTAGSIYNVPVGTAFTSGDYNGDGYEDLAAASGGGRGIWVFRGSEYGLVSPGAFTGGLDNIATQSGPRLSFPFIPANGTVADPVPQVSVPLPGINYGGGGFGTSLGTFKNAYYDNDATKRIRDVLLISEPGSDVLHPSVIHACIPKTDSSPSVAPWGTIGSTVDVNVGLYWDCSNALPFPEGPSISNGFGSSIASFNNPLRYRPDQFGDNATCAFGNGNCSASTINLGFPGGFAVGDSNTQKVYIYYGLNNPATLPASPTRDDYGVRRNQFLLKLLANQKYDGTAMSVVTSAPCNASGGTETCSVQKIQHPTNAGGAFGSVISTLTGTVTASNSLAKDSILAVSSPDRNVNLSDGSSNASVGSVQLFMQSSRFETNPIRVAGDPDCENSVGCVSRLADGFSNSLTQSLDYDGPISTNVYFGKGGVVSGPLFSVAGGGSYSANNDIIVGAPGHVGTSGSAKIIDNGAALVFFSHSGVYRNYRPAGDSGSSASAWHILDRSFSQESDLKFHQVVSLGDINQDGAGDVAVRINQGSRNFTRIYRGKLNSLSFDKSPTGFTDLKVIGDDSAGLRLIPMGTVTNGTFPNFWLTGRGASYLLFGSIGGITTGFPTAFGTGGVPRKFSFPATVSTLYPAPLTPLNSFGIGYLGFADGYFYNSESTDDPNSGLQIYNNFAHGDFNGDGYEDFAIGYTSYIQIVNPANASACTTINPGGCYFPATAGGGRVMIFYGGADNGFQIQPDVNGGYPLSTAYVSDYSANVTFGGGIPTGTGSHSISTPHSSESPASQGPCSKNGSNCKIQMISENLTSRFGSAISSFPAGKCTNTISGRQVDVSGLAVSSGNGLIYTYRPKCLDQDDMFSGLVSYAEHTSASDTPLTSVLRVPAGSSSAYGFAVSAIKGMMGASPSNSNITSHLVVTDQNASRVIVYPVTYSSSAAYGIESYTSTANGGALIDYNTSLMMGTPGSGADLQFGNTITAVGDMNADGFTDVGIGISKLNKSNVSTQISGQGAALVLFGSSNGLQALSSNSSAIEPSRIANCYISPISGSVTSTCLPTLIYPPSPSNSLRLGAFERLSLSPHSVIKTTNGMNEGLGSLLLGVPGRDSLEDTETNRILQGGAFYVLP